MDRGSSMKVIGAGRTSRVWIVVLFTLVSLQAATVLSQGGITDPVEKSALLAFKAALIDGPQNNLQTWTTTSDPCLNNTWIGVYCFGTNYTDGYQHVTELRMFTWYLKGELVPELGNLSQLLTLDVMWNQLTGGIPATLGKLANLQILALNGNNLSGPIPDELGKLTNMNRIQLDSNNLTGPLPNTFGGLVALKHMHLNNNSLQGQIPPQLGQLPNLIHILLDNNQLQGPLPEEISNITTLVILQLDNNIDLNGGIPANYSTKLTKLSKLSLRNCSLSGQIPDLSALSLLYYIDLSYNSFNGTFPNMDYSNLTTIDFSHNALVGGIPSDLTGNVFLQTLQLKNNNLNGSIPDVAAPIVFTSGTEMLLDFQNNSFNYISLGLVTEAAHQPELDLRLSGNPDICSGSQYISELNSLCNPAVTSKAQAEGDVSSLPTGGPIVVTYRLKSPSFSYFTAGYESNFVKYIATGLMIDPEQVSVHAFQWEPGPRLLLILLIDPPPNSKFNETEVNRIQRAFSNWDVSNSTIFGPYELLGFEFMSGGNSKLGKGGIIGIVLGAIAILILILLLLALLVTFRRRKLVTSAEKRRLQMLSYRASQQHLLKITGVSSFTYNELAKATEDFSETREVGRGGYGKVYRGVLESGQIVAIKRANMEAIQRNNEFYNEIELLSRCHHRNLVALVGYCNDSSAVDQEEQMLVYEFMEQGTLHEHLHHTDEKKSLNFPLRLKIALGSAKGILYLHKEANPPIFHRDIKSNNILLDDKRQAKVSDFGLSRLAPDFGDDFGVETASHISTVVKGTPGYLDPEYFLTRKLTDKSDVYSFGVVLLELITGMQPITYGKNIVREVKTSLDAGEMSKVIDQKMGPYPSDIMDPFLTLAMSCVNSDTDARPTMTEVTRTLERLAISAQEKGLKSVLSMDVSMDRYPVQPKEDPNFNSSAADTGFDTGSSQNQTDSNFIEAQGKGYVSPR